MNWDKGKCQSQTMSITSQQDGKTKEEQDEKQKEAKILTDNQSTRRSGIQPSDCLSA